MGFKKNEDEEPIEVAEETNQTSQVIEEPVKEAEIKQEEKIYENQNNEMPEKSESVSEDKNSSNDVEEKPIEEPKVAEESKPVENIKAEQKDETANKENSSKTYKQVKEVKEKKKLDKKWKILIIVIIALVLILALVSTMFAVVNMGNNNIIDGVKVKGIELVGLSKEDAKKEIEDAIKNELSKSIILKYEDYETTISPEQIEAKYDIDQVVEEVYNYGRNGNILQNNYAILGALINGKEFTPIFSYNEKALTDMLNDISKKIPGAIKDNSYYIDGDKLIVTKGKPGIAVKTDEMQKAIIDQVKNPVNNLLMIKVKNASPDAIKADKIYEEVKKEPKNAYVSQEPFEVHPSENGIDFAISLEEARKILQEDKEEYEIPLKYISPEILTSDLGEEAFPDLITKFSTRYDAGLINRSKNLWLASEKINGTVLLPGEEFSYNRVVGERTVEAGYREAAIYSGGEVVDGLGGGICQISSTLYDLAVQGNMKITDRSNHQFVTSYIDAGKDATVVYGYIDFKFVNTRKYPIKIESVVEDGIVEMKMFGVREETEYDIRLETDTIDVLSYGVSYIDDPTMDAGEEYVKQYGASGYNTVTYKIYRLNGEEVNREVLSYDTYDAMTKIIVRGTRNVQPVVVTTPAPVTPAPTPAPATPKTNTTT